MKLSWSDWASVGVLVLSYLHFKKGETMAAGTKELTELLDLIVDGINDGVAVMADGKIDILDVLKLQNLLPEILPAIQGLNLIPAELTGMTVDEGSELVQHVVAKLGVSNTHAIGIVKASTKLAASVYELVLAIKAPA